MDLSYLEQIIKLFEDSTLTELEIDEEGSRITLGRAKEQQVFSMPQMQGYSMPQMPQQGAAPAAASAPAASSAKTHEVKSPIVGTFYRAPSPDADSYVQVGQHVDNGTTLCIIEAMKLMNEIESDTDGEIAAVYVENGQPVQYGDRLFAIKTDK